MKYLVANLKMNMDYEQTKEYVKHFVPSKHIIFCPSYPFLPLFLEQGLTTGVQDISTRDMGSYTGEISALQVSQMGIQYTIIGHSERRKYHGDMNETISLKIQQAQNGGLGVILCVGEQKGQDLKEILATQLSVLSSNVDLKNIMIAYEPVWAIGSGWIPTQEEVYRAIDFIKQYIQKQYGATPPVLYGGSVDDRNITMFKAIPNVDGLLVGKASCNISQFQNMISFLDLH